MFQVVLCPKDKNLSYPMACCFSGVAAECVKFHENWAAFNSSFSNRYLDLEFYPCLVFGRIK